jgi:hypothetical protein
MEHGSKIKKWLDKSPEHRLVTVTGTPSVDARQRVLMSDLQSLGVVFEESTENAPNLTYKGMNGQICFVKLADQHHGATVERQGFAYSHSFSQGNSFAIASAAEHQKVIGDLGAIT